MSNKIIGNGLIASALSDLPSTLEPLCFFASGVSNSGCIDLLEFQREELMLSKIIDSLDSSTTLVYFSTCSIYDVYSRRTPYINHKHNMEKLVEMCNKFLIIRLPQVVGYSKNRYTLTNYIRDSIINDKMMKIQKGAIRNIIDVVDVVKLSSLVIHDGKFLNCSVNIANPSSTSVEDLVGLMEKILQKRALYNYIEAEPGYIINTSIIESFLKKTNINFKDNYVEKVLSKYYGSK